MEKTLLIAVFALILFGCVPSINEPINNSNIRGTKWHVENIGVDSIFIDIIFKTNDKFPSEKNKVVFVAGSHKINKTSQTSGHYMWSFDWENDNVVGHDIFFYYIDIGDDPTLYVPTKSRSYNGEEILDDYREIKIVGMYIEESPSPQNATLELYDFGLTGSDGVEHIFTTITRTK